MLINSDMMDFSVYPKRFELDDGIEVFVRPMRPDDRDRLFAFFRHLPHKDRRFFKHDVSQREVITNWCENLDYDRVLPILAILKEEDGRERVVADATLHTERHGWSTHVAEVRLTIHKMFRRKGLGKIMLREIYDRAMMRGVAKVQAMVRADNEGAIKLLRRLGFRKEAIFRKHAMDINGRKHDVVIFFNDVGALWKKMEDLNIDYDFFVMP
ncbi:MAG: GNAT family N-acetyltransferase [Deltaproteobacteria bacterium]|nr:GNAT family N-acetyltransferase [Deltaproteobacteria bacterium]